MTTLNLFSRSTTAVSFALAAVAAAVAVSAELPWLDEVQRPPGAHPAGAPTLPPLLEDRDGKPIGTLEAWRARRGEILKTWLDFLGRFPEDRGPVKLDVLEEDRKAGCVRQLVRYDAEPGCPVEGYLLHPEEVKGRVPGVVVLHSTVDHTIRQPAGLDGPEQYHFALKLARRGFAAFAPRCFLWQYKGKDYLDAVRWLAERHPDVKGMAKMLHDARRAVDVLQSLPFVDGDRIGCIGHSLGAKEALYLAAFDERVKAAVSSEGGIGLGFSNWEAPWYLGPSIKEKGFPLENHQVLALVAPRSFLLIGGDDADGDRSWPSIAAVLPIYDLLGAPRRAGLFNHRKGHAVPPEAEERTYAWLARYLGSGEGAERPREDPAAGKGTERHLLYVAVPGIRDELQYGGHGILVFDMDAGHRFVKRIPAAGLGETGKPLNVKGVCASAATGRIYLSTIRSLTCFDLVSEEVLWEKVYEGGCDRMAISPDGKVIYLPTLEKDRWHIVDALDGKVIARVETRSGAHNTICGLDGGRAYLAGLSSPLLTVIEKETYATVRTVGPFSASIRPFTVNGRGTLCFVNVNDLLGFEVGDLATGKMLHRVEVKDFEKGPVKRHGCPSHGIGMTPDESEIWLSDGANCRLHIFDARAMPPRQVASIRVRDQPGWITFSLDGRLAYPSTGDVIDAARREVVTGLKDETGADVQSEKMLEIDFGGGKPVRTGDQFGVGRARG